MAKSIVYYSKEINQEALQKVYQSLGVDVTSGGTAKVAPFYLMPNLSVLALANTNLSRYK